MGDAIFGGKVNDGNGRPQHYSAYICVQPGRFPFLKHQKEAHKYSKQLLPCLSDFFIVCIFLKICSMFSMLSPVN